MAITTGLFGFLGSSLALIILIGTTDIAQRPFTLITTIIAIASYFVYGVIPVLAFRAMKWVGPVLYILSTVYFTILTAASIINIIFCLIWPTIFGSGVILFTTMICLSALYLFTVGFSISQIFRATFVLKTFNIAFMTAAPLFPLVTIVVLFILIQWHYSDLFLMGILLAYCLVFAASALASWSLFFYNNFKTVSYWDVARTFIMLLCSLISLISVAIYCVLVLIPEVCVTTTFCVAGGDTVVYLIMPQVVAVEYLLLVAFASIPLTMKYGGSFKKRMKKQEKDSDEEEEPLITKRESELGLITK